MYKKKAFTLVELLIVIGIICIVAAVMIPVLTGVLNKSKEQTEEVSAGLYTSIMQKFANEKAGEPLLYPGLTTTGEDAEYSVLSAKSGKGMFPGYNILNSDNDDDTYDAIRREAIIAVKAYSDVKTLDGYYVESPSKEHYQYVYYYLTGQVTIEDERTKTPVSKSAVENGTINVEDYWVYLSRSGGSGDAVINGENGTGMVFVQIRQFGTDKLLDDVKVSLRIGSEIRTANTGANGTVGFSDIELGSVFVEAEKLGAVSFPNSEFYTENGQINIKKGGYVGDSAANPYVITLKMGSLGSIGFYRRTHTWTGTAWQTENNYITDDVLFTSAFTVDESRTVGIARNETYYTNASASAGRQELLTPDGKFLLYGPYNLEVSGDGFRDYHEEVVSRVYGIDNYKNNGEGEYANADSPYEYPIVMKRPQGKGEVTGVISWERQMQPLAGTTTATGTWTAGQSNYWVYSRVVMQNKTTGTKYYSSYFSVSSSGKYSYSIKNLPDGDYSIYLYSPYGANSYLDLSQFPDTVTVDGSEVVVNARVLYADVDNGSIDLTVTYDYRGNYDPISGAKVDFIRLGSTGYYGRKTNDSGKTVLYGIKRGFMQIRITLPSYIGTATYTYKLFVNGNKNITIRLPIAEILVSGTITGYKPDKNPIDIAGSFDGLSVSFVRYNADGTKKYSSVSADVSTSGVDASYSVAVVPGMYKIVTDATCYKGYAESETLMNFKEQKAFDFSLDIDGNNIKCHPEAKIAWHQDSANHWQQCSKCGTVFNKKAHTYSAWTASGTSGCYRYCTETHCARVLDPVTAHDYRYKTSGSYASTCVTNGNKHYECYRCSYGKDESIPKSGHNYGAWSSNDGSTHSRYCRNSGCDSKQTEDHSFNGWYWVSHEIQMSSDGSCCYTNGTQRTDCLTCGYYKFNYPKVAHSIECFMMRENVDSSTYYNIPTNYSSAYFVTNSGRVYMRLGSKNEYNGRQTFTPGSPSAGLYGMNRVLTARTSSVYTRSAVFNSVNSHYVACANRPVINGVTYYCHSPICHNGDPYRTSYQCGCANKPLGYVLTPSGYEIIPNLNPAWVDPYKKQGRR